MADPFQPKFVDLVRNLTSTTGTGNFTLGAAVTGFTSFASAVLPGESFYYSAIGVDKPAEREVGRGTMQANGTISRDPIGGVKTNFTSGSKSIALIAAAEWFSQVQTSGTAAAASATSAATSATQAVQSATSAAGSATAAAVSATSAQTAEAGAIVAKDQAVAAGSAGGNARAATRAALAAISPGDAPVYLTERGCEGVFLFDSANLTSKVSADTRQGIYVAPASDTDGSSGAWVRRFSGPIDIRWFGYVADDNGATGTDNLAAINAALTVAPLLSGVAYYEYRGAPTIIFPEGYAFVSGPINLKVTVHLKGETSGQAGIMATRLRFPQGSAGIIVNLHATLGYGNLPGATTYGVGSIIEGLGLLGGIADTLGGGAIDDPSAQADGILMRGRAIIRNCQVMSFQRNGIAILAGSDGNPLLGNANNWRIDTCRLTYNGQHGLHVKGTDANAGVAILVDSELNRDDGICDDSFLGNTYVACHVAGNARGYSNLNDNAASVFLGCYSEAGQAVSTFSQPCITVGGQHGAGINTGAWIYGTGGQVGVSALKVAGAFSVNGQQVSNTVVNLGPNGGPAWQADYYLNTTASDNTMWWRSWSGDPQNDGMISSNRGYGMVIRGYGMGGAAGKLALQSGATTILEVIPTGVSVTGSLLASGAIAVTGAVTASNLSGTNSGDQTITLTGDVTGSGTGSFAATIGANKVTFAKFVAATAAGIVGAGAAGNFQQLGLAGGLSISGANLTLDGGAIAPASVAATGALTSSGGGVGYATGAGGTVTQATSKATAVTLNKLAGKITMNAAALAAAAVVEFTVTNSLVTANDTINLNLSSGAAAGSAYRYWISAVAAGSFKVVVENRSAGALSEAVALNFAVLKAVIA